MKTTGFDSKTLIDSVNLTSEQEMLRSLLNLTKLAVPRPAALPSSSTRPAITALCRNYSLFQPQIAPSLCSPTGLSPVQESVRTVTKFSWGKGKRKSVHSVLERFYRLHWGIWIRRKAGCHKHLWKKSPQRKRRLRQHVFCNATQSYLLDKMVGSYWRKPRYYVNDPYEPYHSREEFHLTAKKPRPYSSPEQI
ncbi:39S ribosomal protein L35, mitochondrial [Dendroctonus ponderosae]